MILQNAAKRVSGLLLGLGACLFIYFMPDIDGLPVDGKHCLAVTTLGIAWWIFNVAHFTFVSIVILSGYALFVGPETAPPELVFKFWITPTMLLVVGGFLIASAVQTTGLGRRLALVLVTRVAGSYRGVIVACYLVSFPLGLLVPHPFPRAFILMSIMAVVITETGLEGEDAANVGLAVFTAQVFASMLFLTSDSVMNLATVGMVPPEAAPGWLGWLAWMSAPALFAGFACCATQLLLHPGPRDCRPDLERLRAELRDMGRLSGKEIRLVACMTAAVLMWLTDFHHGVHAGWIMIAAAMTLALPGVGDVITAADWKRVNLSSLFFTTVALAIGNVGNRTGMSAWLGNLFIPASIPGGIVPFMLLTIFAATAVHMILGTGLGALSVLAPILTTRSEAAGMPQLAAVLVIFVAVQAHWVLPYHNVIITIGAGDVGRFSERHIIRLGLAMTVPMVLVCFFQLAWWKLLGFVP